MSHEIERFVGNRASKPWWLTAGTAHLADMQDQDVVSSYLRANLFNFTIDRMPLTATLPDGTVIDVPDHFAQVRSDTSESIAVVGKVWKGFQPDGIVDTGDLLVAEGQGEVRWHTAAVLKGGRKVFGLAEFGDQFQVANETLRTYLLFSDAFDGSGRHLVKAVNTCTVCSNTLELALGEKGGNLVTLRHGGSMEDKRANALEALGILREGAQREVATIEKLMGRDMSRSEFSVFVCQMLTSKDDAEEAQKVIAESKGRSKTMYDGKGAELMRLWDEGQGAEERGNTAWRGLGTVAEFIDWQRGRMGNYKARSSKLGLDGVDSALFGDGARKKRRALRLLTK